MFSGAFNPESSIPKGWIWFYRYSRPLRTCAQGLDRAAPYNKAASALSVIQFGEATNTIDVNTPGGVVPQRPLQFLETLYVFKFSERWLNTLVLFAYAAFFILFAGLFYSKIRHNRR